MDINVHHMIHAWMAVVNGLTSTSLVGIHHQYYTTSEGILVHVKGHNWIDFTVLLSWLASTSVLLPCSFRETFHQAAQPYGCQLPTVGIRCHHGDGIRSVLSYSVHALQLTCPSGT